MIADYDTMPHMFWECNRLYFDLQLRTYTYKLMENSKYFSYLCTIKH